MGWTQVPKTWTLTSNEGVIENNSAGLFPLRIILCPLMIFKEPSNIQLCTKLGNMEKFRFYVFSCAYILWSKSKPYNSSWISYWLHYLFWLARVVCYCDNQFSNLYKGKFENLGDGKTGAFLKIGFSSYKIIL